jgi:hypothetical protein
MKKCCFNSAMVRSEKFEMKRAEKKIIFIVCGSKRNKRYDSTGLLSDKKQLIYGTGTVQRWWSTPNWSDGHQGCS